MPVGLIVVAHPDDDALFGGPFQLANNWIEWHVVCATYLEGDERGGELVEWQRRLGAKSVAFLGLSDCWDGGSHDIGFTADDVLRLMRQQLSVKPDLVLTHNSRGEYGHPHHVAVGKAVRQLFGDRRIIEFAHGLDEYDFEVHVPDMLSAVRACYASQAPVIELLHDQSDCCRRGRYRIVTPPAQQPPVTAKLRRFDWTARHVVTKIHLALKRRVLPRARTLERTIRRNCFFEYGSRSK